ncbi:Inner membrane protein RclC [compost metagenome]
MEHQNTKNSTLLLKSGKIVLRYGLVVVLVWIGMLKFTSYEAEGIRPLAEHSPFFSWTYNFLSTRDFSNILGVIEIAIGLLIALRPFSAKLSAIGSIGGVITFLITLTFLLSTPGVIQEGMSFPFISGSPGQFLIKDIVLLGASLWTAGEALTASHK